MTAAPAAPQPLTGGTLWLAALVLALGNFVVVLDSTIANVSVPHIAGSLAVSPTQGVWAITSYSVADAIAVPLSGWLAVRFGVVRWFTISLIGFATFSMLCGLSRSIEMLVFFRICQGFSGGPLMPLSQALLLNIFPERQRGAAIGLWAATTTAAPILGPLLGGYISDNLSWPWIFFINLPVLLLCVVVVQRLLKPFETRTQRMPIDVIGLALLVLGIGAFQMMLDTGREKDWFGSAEIVVLAIVAGIGTISFVIWELTAEHPIVDLKLFRHRGFAAATVAIALGFGAFFSIVVITPLWLQSVLGTTASNAGKVVAWIGMFAVLMSPIAGRLVGRIDLRITVTAGILWLGATAWLRTTWSSDSDYWALALPHILGGLGMPFFFIGLSSLAFASVDPKDQVSAAGIMSFMRTLCGAIGTAVATTSWDDSAREARVRMVETLNDPAGVLASLQMRGLSLEQARATLERLVETQAYTVSTIQVYSRVSVVFVLAAAAVWLIPKVKTMAPMGPSH
jgi:DHA2 family multidrug resistance protein